VDPNGLPRVLGRSGVGCRKNEVAGRRCQRRTRDAAIDGNLDVSRCFLERCDPITFEERQECSLTDTGLVDCGLRLSKKYRCSHWCLLGGLIRSLIKSKGLMPGAMHMICDPSSRSVMASSECCLPARSIASYSQRANILYGGARSK
jgi:hypothetical protein